VKTKMQLVLGKMEMNEFTEKKCLPNLELKFKF